MKLFKKRKGWQNETLEYRQGYFWGLITIVSFSIGINIGIGILPMQKLLTTVPATGAIVVYGILAIKIIPF